MGKISILDIANILIEIKGLSPKSAELFVTTMFDVVQLGLERDKSVKIKGLGTFKIIDVEARESINVNTGERVVIEGHGKITFTPDSVMKELVNKPFSQFETVILNDGVEFDDIDDSAKISNSSTILKESEETSENQIIDVAPTPIEEVDEMNKNVAREKAVEEYINRIANNEHLNVEPTHINEVETVGESLSEMETTEDTVKEQEVEPAVVSATPISDLNNEDIADDGDYDEEEDSNKSGFLKWLLLSIFIIVLILSAAYGGYLYGLKVATEKQQHANGSDAVLQLPVTDNIIVSDSVSVNDTIKSDSIKADKVNDSVQAAKPATIDNKSVSATDKFDSEKYEEMDARVRTGAYRIIGTDYTVVIRQGETMKRLCKRTLGEGMACYIEVYNDLMPNEQLVAGRTIKIPKLEWKKKRKQ